MDIGVQRASKKYGVSQQALLDAARRGALPAFTVPVLQLRFRHKDIVAYLATIPEWRKRAGRKGAEVRWGRLPKRAEVLGPKRAYRARTARSA